MARIVDEEDASEAEREIDEVATSVYCFRHSVLAPALRRLSPDNSLGEYYLTDAVAVLHDAGYAVRSLVADDPMEAAEVNDRAQLAAAEAELRSRINERWMRRGVTMTDPEQTYLDTTVQLEPDVTLLPGVILEGRTSVGAGAVIGPSCHLIDCEVGARRAACRTPSPPTWWWARAPSSGPSPCSIPAHGWRPTPESGHSSQEGSRHRRARASRPRVARRSRKSGTNGRRRLGRWRSRRHGGSSSSRARPTPSSPRRSPPASASKLGEANFREFADGEIHCRFDASIRGADVFIIQTHCAPVNDSHHGAAHHDRRRQAGLGPADHRRLPVLRLLPPGPQVDRAASRSPRSSSPTCSRPRASTGSSASTCTPARSRASSTSRSTTSPRRRSCSTTCASTGRTTSSSSSPDAGRVKVAERFSQLLGTDLAFVHKRRPRGTIEPGRGDRT